MKLSRRSFLQNTTAAALTAVVLGPLTNTSGQVRNGGKHFSGLIEPSPDPFASLTQQSFVPFIGEVWSVINSAGRTVQIRIIEANSLRHGENEKRGYTGESFSLIFESSRKSRIAGDLYQFDHYALGQFSLLLVPVGRMGTRYEAIVNRIGK